MKFYYLIKINSTWGSFISNFLNWDGNYYIYDWTNFTFSQGYHRKSQWRSTPTLIFSKIPLCNVKFAYFTILASIKLFFCKCTANFEEKRFNWNHLLLYLICKLCWMQKFRSLSSLALFSRFLLLHLQKKNAAKILHSSIEIVFVFSLEDVEMSGCTLCPGKKKIQCKFLHK